MKRKRYRRVGTWLYQDAGLQDDCGELATTILIFPHDAFGFIRIAGHDDAATGAQMKIPKLVASGECGDDQLLGIPS